MLAGLGLALALAGCGDEEEPVDGRGYSYSVPDGYENATDEAEDNPELDLGAGIRPDTLVVGDSEDGFASNVNVIREPGVPEDITPRGYAEVTLRALRDPAASGFPPELVETLEDLKPRRITAIRDTELGGEDAVTWDYRSNQEGRALRIRQVAVLMDGTAYSVTLTAVSDRFEEELGAFDEVLESWEFD